MAMAEPCRWRRGARSLSQGRNKRGDTEWNSFCLGLEWANHEARTTGASGDEIAAVSAQRGAFTIAPQNRGNY